MSSRQGADHHGVTDRAKGAESRSKEPKRFVFAAKGLIVIEFKIVLRG